MAGGKVTGEEQAIVIQTSPLIIKTDPSETQCPARIDSGLTIAVGSRVRAQIRNPIPPLVIGVDS